MKIYNIATFMGLSSEQKEDIRDNYEVFHHGIYNITVAIPKEQFRELLGKIQQYRGEMVEL